MTMSCAVRNLAAKTAGKESLAMESFAYALAQLPTIIADNAGSNPVMLHLNSIHVRCHVIVGNPVLISPFVSSFYYFRFLNDCYALFAPYAPTRTRPTPLVNIKQQGCPNCCRGFGTGIRDYHQHSLKTQKYICCSGLDSAQLVANIRAAHNTGDKYAGIG